MNKTTNMKTIKLFMDFEFTSLSPDAQCISLGIVSEDMKPCDFPNEYPKDELISFSDYKTSSFYAEFSDFDINRCDDWVKENVVKKLKLTDKHNDWTNCYYPEFEIRSIFGRLGVRTGLMEWLKQFSDYQIQFVCDCGTFDWYWMLQLLAEWEEKPVQYLIDASVIPSDMTITDFMKGSKDAAVFIKHCEHDNIPYKTYKSVKTGLPKLPDNISPVPEDLNDLIARVEGISVREAFDLNREELAGYVGLDLKGKNYLGNEKVGIIEVKRIKDEKHNALWDAKVIKEIYQKLK